MTTETKTGWIQCTQCGNGHPVTQGDVDAGDITDGQTCSHCGFGPMKIDWRPRGHVAVVLGDTSLPDVSPIYTVTVMYLGFKDRKPGEENTTNPREVEMKRSRTWGWYPTLERATKAVMENHTDMYEMGYYNCACIEERPTGAAALPTKEHWFEVEYVPMPNHRDDTYNVTPIEKPPALKMFVGFAW